MPPRVFEDLESLKTLVGTDLGVSDWLEITQERIDTFARATGDDQWIHVDPERAARESPFGTTVAHGHLTLSLAPTLLAQIARFDGARLLVNPGIERMRLRAPVRRGDRIRMRAHLKQLRELRGGAIRVTLTLRFEIEGSAKPAAFGDALLVLYP